MTRTLPRAGTPAGTRADLVAGLVAAALLAAAALTGAVRYLAGRPVGASAAPVFAHWLPHVGPGTPAAFGVAALVVWHGPRLADRLPWRHLLLAGYATAAAWILSLAMVDGWRRGVADRLTTRHEYLSEVAGVTDVPAMLRTFAGRVVDHPDRWTTHVAGHPPGALLVFVGLDRIGLGGGGWAGLVCVLAGASLAVSVPMTMRALGDEAAARAAVPFVVLFPGAVWLGVSADAVFAAVPAAGLALLATGGRWRAVAGGAVLAFCLYLSYGLVLLLPLVLVVAVRGRRYGWAALGGLGVVVAFTGTGFWWLDGYHQVVRRYHEGIAAERPYWYWVWANLALLGLSAGPAAAAAARRAAQSARRAAQSARRAARTAQRAAAVRTWPAPAALLPLAALTAIAVADLSGLSKAEVERIWLPFAIWLTAGAALLPRRRCWLSAQACTALAVNHLLLTTW